MNKMYTGDQLRKIIRSSGLSQQEVADYLDITRVYLSRLLGKKTFPPDIAAKIIEFTDSKLVKDGVNDRQEIDSIQNEYNRLTNLLKKHGYADRTVPFTPEQTTDVLLTLAGGVSSLMGASAEIISNQTGEPLTEAKDRLTKVALRGGRLVEVLIRGIGE